MRCPKCQHENEDDARFCGACATPLNDGDACPSCGRSCKPGQKFCSGCAHPLTDPAGSTPARNPAAYTPKHLADKILSSRSALQGERKQVTVLFADVKGSMELAEQVDAEQWHGILDRFFQILSDGVHRFEGTVNQYTGDGIMALFGAPIAHEDHAQRACYAVLHLRDRLRRYAEELKRTRGLNFSVRVGLNSGEVVVGKIGDDLRMDYTAQGHTVGLAQRMEQLASPGQAYLTAHTARLVEGYFTLRDLGEFELKGSEKPVGVFELEGLGRLRTRLDMSRTRGLSRFVGRGDEMATLEAALEQSIRGQGQVVGIVADAGVGKSRLCFEFAERCRARDIPVYEGHCPAHGRTIPFLPVLELLRGYFGITDQDRAQAAREKIVGRLLLLDRAFEELLPLVFDFLGIGEGGDRGPRIDPDARQRQLFAFLRQLIQARSEREPSVILIDDLHWIDPGSDAFIAQAVEATATTRTLMLVNFRPEYHTAWSRKTYYRQVPLVPLGPEAIGELITELLGADRSVAALPALIRERTGGNPFFAEEIIQSLIESEHLQGARGAYRLVTPVERLGVPSSVQSVLSARIDRLPPREKQVLQAAAVIGREFDEPCLSRVAEQTAEDLSAALPALTTLEFVVEEALYPRAEYAFKHPLTHEVAYNSQLGGRRARVHAAVARAIEALEPEKLDDRAALLAHHCELGGEPLEAARWNARAAERSRTADPSAAVRQWKKVHDLIGPQPDSEEAEWFRMQACLQVVSVGGWRLGGSREMLTALFDEGKALGEKRGDDVYLAELALAYTAFVGLSTGDMRDYAERSREVARLADKVADPDLQCAASVIVGYSHYRLGRLVESLEAVMRGRELSMDDHTRGMRTIGINTYAWTFMQGAWTELHLGRIAVARQIRERGLELCRSSNDQENLIWTLAQSALLEYVSGDLASGEADALEALHVAETIGSPFSQVVALDRVGLARVMREDWDGAVDVLERSRSLLRQYGTGLEQEAELLAWLSEAHRGAGRLDTARATAEEAIVVARSCHTPIGGLEGRLALARTLLASEGAAARATVETLLDEAQATVEECGARVFEPQILAERACLAELAGDDGARLRNLRAAHRLFTDLGAGGHAERTAKRFGKGAMQQPS
jgi:class 3 adenylate cyclase/tetratricopeptide (TPR) repeat protein